jgi:hypothetical protein
MDTDTGAAVVTGIFAKAKGSWLSRTMASFTHISDLKAAGDG